jgi:hypothetical protein
VNLILRLLHGTNAQRNDYHQVEKLKHRRAAGKDKEYDSAEEGDQITLVPLVAWRVDGSGIRWVEPLSRRAERKVRRGLRPISG